MRRQRWRRQFLSNSLTRGLFVLCFRAFQYASSMFSQEHSFSYKCLCVFIVEKGVLELRGYSPSRPIVVDVVVGVDVGVVVVVDAKHHHPLSSPAHPSISTTTPRRSPATGYQL